MRNLSATTNQVFDEVEDVEAGTTVEIRGRPGRVITGTVRATEGEVTARCLVEAFPAKGEPDPRRGDAIQVWTDEKGWFRLGPLPEGRWDLAALSFDRTRCAYRFDVEAGEVELVLGGERTVRARVLDGKDEPADANVYISLAGRPRWHVHVFAQARRKDGRFAISGLPPGELRVRVVSPRLSIVGTTGGEPVDTSEEITLRLPDE